METLTPNEIERGYFNWSRSYKYADIDRLLETIVHLRFDENWWLRLARQALGLSAKDVAWRLGIDPANVYQLERYERESKISIGKLRQYAEAIDCEFIYFIRPKRRTPFSRIVWDRTYPAFLSHPLVGKGDPNNRGGMLSYLVRRHLSKRRRSDLGECAGILSHDL